MLALIPHPATGALYDPESDTGTLGTAWDSFPVEPTDGDDGCRGRIVTLLRRLGNGDFTFDLFCQIYAKVVSKPQSASIDPRDTSQEQEQEVSEASTNSYGTRLGVPSSLHRRPLMFSRRL